MQPHLATAFPLYFHLWGYSIHPHWLFETLAYVAAFRLYLVRRRRWGDPISTPIRWTVVAAATAGAVFGSKLLFLLEDPQLTLQHLSDPAYLMGGKTIAGALIGGLIAVEAMKRYIGETHSTGDLFSIPLALGIAIGRIGCFLTGLADNTYGTPTTLPWGIDFGDGIRRHPTQLYEILFLLALIPLLRTITTRIAAQRASRFQSGDAFKFFMVAYMTFRLACDSIKPYPHLALGLGAIQWASLLLLVYYARDIRRWLSPSPGQIPLDQDVGQSF